MSFIAELKRRNVFKVAAAYVVVAWLVLQVVDTVAEPLRLPEWTAPLMIVLLGVGFFVALFLAWAYELTPEGVKKAEEVDKDESITHVTGQKINTAIIVLLVVALGYFIWESRFAPQQPAAEIAGEPVAQMESPATEQPQLTAGANLASIAVLPFVNMSSDTEQEYFSDGLSEELLNVLAHIPQLKVAARTSSFYFKGKDVKIADIAKQLSVAHVLEGSVRKAGDKIRITAQLIRAADGFHLWSGTYDRKLDDVFVIQDEIAHAIVDALQVKMGLAEDKSSPIARAIQKTSPEAHNAYLLGKKLLRDRTEKSIKDAIVQFQRALAIDPEFVPALARQAEAWLLLRADGGSYGNLSAGEAINKAAPLLEKAITLNPDSAEALASRGFLRDVQYQDELALQDYERVLSLNPNHTEVRVWRASMLANTWQFDANHQAQKENYERDPLSVLTAGNYLLGKMFRQDMQGYDELLASLKTFGPRAAYRTERIHNIMAYRYNDMAIAALDEYKADGKRKLHRLAIYLGWLGLLDTLQEQIKNSDDWRVQYRVYVTRQEWSKTRSLLEQRMVEDTNEDQRVRIARYSAKEGNWQKSRDLYLKVWQEREGASSKDRGFNIPGGRELVYFAAALQKTGEDEQLAEVIAIISELVQKLKAANFRPLTYLRMEVFLHMVKGETGKALEVLEKEVDKGFAEMGVLDAPWLEDLRPDPRFQALREKARQTLAQQRRQFLADVCASNPWADFWQPGEENCKEVQP